MTFQWNLQIHNFQNVYFKLLDQKAKHMTKKINPPKIADLRGHESRSSDFGGRSRPNCLTFILSFGVIGD